MNDAEKGRFFNVICVVAVAFAVLFIYIVNVTKDYDNQLRGCNDLLIKNSNYIENVSQEITLANKWIWFNKECTKLNSTVKFVDYGYICVGKDYNGSVIIGDSA